MLLSPWWKSCQETPNKCCLYQSPMVLVLKMETKTVMSMCERVYQWGREPFSRAVMTPVASAHSLLTNFTGASWMVTYRRHSRHYSLYLLWLRGKFTAHSSALTTVHMYMYLYDHPLCMCTCVWPFILCDHRPLISANSDFWHQLPTVRTNITGWGHKHKKGFTSDTRDNFWCSRAICVLTSCLQFRGSTTLHPVVNNLLIHRIHTSVVFAITVLFIENDTS